MKYSMNRVVRWSWGMLGLIALIGLPVLAQQAGRVQEGALSDAQQKMKLIEDGQATLMEAAQLAERHTNGRALEATCAIQRTPSPRTQEGSQIPGDRAERSRATQGPRLIYTIDCFVRDKVLIARVDGLERRVDILGQPDKPPVGNR